MEPPKSIFSLFGSRVGTTFNMAVAHEHSHDHSEVKVVAIGRAYGRAYGFHAGASYAPFNAMDGAAGDLELPPDEKTAEKLAALVAAA